MRTVALAFVVTAMSSTCLAAPLTIMSYNVENLFDAVDDPSNPHDDTYLPFALKQARGAAHIAHCDATGGSDFNKRQCRTLDWNEAVYTTKLQRISEVIRAVPTPPDILVLPETENKKVVDDLVAAVGASSFQTVVALDTSDKPDSRGIDVAIVSKLPLAAPAVAHKIDFGSDASLCGATRDIVEAKFVLPDNDTVTVLGVHFPSQGNDEICRIRAFQAASAIRRALGDAEQVVMAGDLNFDCTELASPMYDRLVQRGGWYLPPEITSGCNAPGSSKFVDRSLDSWNTWSFLDQILISASLSPSQPTTKNWFGDLGSFQTLVVTREQTAIDDQGKGYVEPRRFDPVGGHGVSDHWPVMLRLLNRR